VSGQAIQQAREAAGLSQSELAVRSGVAQPNISAYESGVRRPSPKMVQRLVSAARPRPSAILAANRVAALALAEANKAADVRVFGSIARQEDTPDSDVDILVRFRDGASLLDQSNLAIELSELLGVHVDVVSEGGLRDRHDDIRSEAVPL
jgi:predicted nucleotidyltransferase